MELHINEKNVSNIKRVTFVTDPEDDVEDVLYEDIYVEKEEHILHNVNQAPTIGKFQTINRPKVNPMSNPQPKTSPPPPRPLAPPTIMQRPSTPSQRQSITQPPPPQKRPQISYDDILKSMNMKVGPDGKLQMYSEKLQEEHINQQIQQHQNMSRPHNSNHRYSQQTQPIYQQYAPLPPNPNPVPIPHTPLTKRQYQQMLALQIIRRQQEQQRIKQIKSTKLIFPNPNVYIATSSRPANRLFGFK